MAQLQLKHIPIADLHVSKLNMRHARKKPDVSDILPSIRTNGVRQTLLVRPEGKGFGVVAGRRRLFALREVAKETGKPVQAPCAILGEADDAAAIEASILENVARLPATEMQQYVAFKNLSDQGQTVTQIAEQFGITELNVRRVLALAALLAPIRKLYDEGELDRDTIRALTLGTKDQQTEWLRMHGSKTERAPRARQCKAWIAGGSAITTDKALFDLSTYDGKIAADLFGEHGVFSDVETFWQHQSKAIADKLEAYAKAGWRDTVVLERGQWFASYEYEKRARTKGGKVFVELRHDGTVTFHEGYLTKAEAARLSKANDGDSNDESSVKPELSGPLTEYVSLHRHGAARASLLAHPGIALRLMLANIMGGSPHYDVRPHAITSRKEATEESIASSKAERELTDAHAIIAEMLETRGVNPSIRTNGDSYRVCQLFTCFLKMDDAEVMQVLTFVMADTLTSGGPMVEAVLATCETDLSEYWQPDTAMFELLRDKRLVNAMLEDIAGKSLAASMLADTAKVQKQAIENRIAGEGCDPATDWRPGFMAFPPRRYRDGAPSAPADAWARISALFEPKTDNDPQIQDAA